MRDRDLVRLHWPRELRPAFDALFGIDDAMAHVVATASQPALGAIKLAWWREALERLDTEPPPAEPRLQAAALELLPRRLSGADLAALERPWALLLMSDQSAVFMDGAINRGPTLFRLAARLLGVEFDDNLHNAAQCFSSIDLGRRGIWNVKPQKLRRPAQRAPRRVRPLTALEVLARRDMITGGPPFEPEATPARSWTLIRHRLTGR